MYFDEVQNSTSHTYKIESLRPDRRYPVVRTLLSSPSRPVDMPDRQLLAVHRACAKIVHLSGAGDYIQRLLDDFDCGMVRTDGLSDLGSMVSLRMCLTSNTACHRA